MYTTINGWTKESMKAQVRARMTAKSVTNNPRACAYRSEVNGERTACAIGCFIPNDRYTPELEGILPLPESECVSYPKWFELTKGIKFPLDSLGLRAMQVIHDRSKQANPADEVCDWIDANVEDGK
jgi:hypothetical protein